MNPFDMNGEQFLMLYGLLAVPVLIAAYLLREHLRQPGGQPAKDDLNLVPYEVAYLAGGEALAINAGLANLVQQKVLLVSPTTRKVTVTGDLPADADPIERALFTNASLGTDGKLLKDVREAATGAAQRLSYPLRKAGLVMSDGQQVAAQMWPTLLVAGLAAFGVVKIFVGMMRDRPVGFLVMACIATGFAALVGFLVRKPHRSRRGDVALEELRIQYSPLKATAQSNVHLLAGATLPLAVGLFGMGILSSGGPLGDLRTGLNAQYGSSSSCGSGCGSSGGDGGGGGCGGCGGGGD